MKNYIHPKLISKRGDGILVIINIKDFKIKKMNRTMVEMSETIKQGGMSLGDACYILAYKAREYAARMEANEKELNKLKT